MPPRSTSFRAQGFAALPRLDDVAKRAGVAKGTIYLYFADKETLFQELARSMLSPLVGNIESLAAVDMPFADAGGRPRRFVRARGYRHRGARTSSA